MSIFKREFHVKPNTIGYLYQDNKLLESLDPGLYKYWDWDKRMELYSIPTTSKFLTVTNQEVLTKDNIALRFSFNIVYRIIDGQKLLTMFPLDTESYYIISQLEERICNIVQIFLRDRIAEFESESINEKRTELTEFKTEKMEDQVKVFGVTIEQAQFRDLTFPKSIQELFSKHLEAKIKAKADLENARTAVAKARTLKNAAEIMKGDEHMKFIQLLESIEKIADKGKHTFNFGDISQIAKIETK